ncbi:hypothetical protein LUX01_02650 [Streptomyces sudanensis]|uniref:hypothetical protein n=1 Tax=Streptomyces sudanensis TaxID=436397 RepID=UPI0020CF29B0|nr:hypothetical protein [Streptomyces sudanensis]MCP9985760.1 hypothetical protein [Streptomyces sudanensis]
MPQEKEARSLTERDAYELITKLFSKTISDQITEALRKLRDPESFSVTVRDLGREQKVKDVDMLDPDALYDGFWKLYTGCNMDLSWSNSSGVPTKSFEIVEEIAPSRKPAPPSDDDLQRFLDIEFDWGPFHGSIHI